MNKFRKLGFISYGVGLRINDSLLSAILQDQRIGQNALRMRRADVGIVNAKVRPGQMSV
jgi:hypothetical protein